MTRPIGCALCDEDGGKLLFTCDRYRVVRAHEKDFPAFFRVIWNGHVREFSDLDAAARAACMDAVVTVERVLRDYVRPDKINLATLGNAVPHLHWHVIGRYTWDTHYPSPIWAGPQRERDIVRLKQLEARLADVEKELPAALARLH